MLAKPKPKVWIDARMAGGHGIGRYVRDLALGLAAGDWPFAPAFLLPSEPVDPAFAAFECRASTIPFLHWSEPWRLGPELGLLKPDLYVSPSFASLWRYPCPHAQIVHDLIHLDYGNFAQRLYYRHLLLPSLAKAKAVASVSPSAASQIQEWLRAHKQPRPVAIVPNSIAPAPIASLGALARLGLAPRDYFFCLSNPKPHKNIPMLLEAYRQAGPGLPPLVTNAATSARTHAAPRAVPSPAGQAKNAGQSQVIPTGPLSESEIHGLMAEARVFLFPSLLEGFGRPPLEAALAGTAALAANIPPLREALAGVSETTFLDPRQPAAWAEALRRHGVSAKQPLSESSRAWVLKNFSPAKQAAAFAQLVETALAPTTQRR